MGGGSIFSVIHCGSFYGKFNKLPMDEDAIRRELEHSGNDEDYLSDLDEEFRDLSSEEDNGVNQVSRADPSCTKARISVRTLSVESENSEEEIGVERKEKHVIKSESDSETNVAIGGGSGCAGGDDGNGEETESNGASTRGRTYTSDNRQRLNGMLHMIVPHSKKKHKDCIVCSKQNVPGGRNETTYFCETCDRKPGLHMGTCFKQYHTLKKFKL